METQNLIPKHIAIQMDGNRRWAKNKSLSIFSGHDQGATTLKNITEYCQKKGVKVLTVYALSTENFKKRSKEELNYHFSLHKKYIKQEILDSDQFVKNKIRFQVLGRKDLLPEDEQELIKEAEEKTKDFSDYFFNVCLCYNGQDELVDATKEIIKQGINPEEINRETIKQHLYTKDLPPPDMMIKTGMNPEKRVSAFLLYDIAYSELFFTPILWPDFSPEELDKMIKEYQTRQRRHGE